MGFVDTALRLAEERLGISVLATDEVSKLREDVGQYRALSAEAEELAIHTLDYFGGRPNDLRRESRRNLTQRSRVAFMKDPLAGTEAEHYANFALGRGVGKPTAKDTQVQEAIDEAWEDPNNVDKLTGYEALRAISNELRAGSNVFPVAFIKNGKVKVSFIPADTVEHIVEDPEDELRPLWYLVRVAKREWDFVEDREKADVVGANFQTKYFAHWRNVELLNEEIKNGDHDAVASPPQSKRGKGLVYHVRTNRLLHQKFGTPYWARTLRFMDALNRMMEARVSMALAASSFIAKRVMQGGPDGVLKAAQSVIKQTGEIGAVQNPPDPRGRAAAPPPASLWNENYASKIEPFTLNSGASGAETDARLIRSSATAPSAFGPHYFSDPGSSNLATASSLELPSLMAVGAWQEMLQGLLRWFTDLVIQEAVRSGRLGGATADTKDEGDKPLSELRLSEAEDKSAAERRTGKDLSYDLAMPYPGRRDLQAVTTAFVSVMTQLSPIGENDELTKIMLNFLFTHGLELEDPVAAAELVVKVQQKLLKNQAAAQAEQAQAQAAQVAQQQLPAPADPNAPPGDRGSNNPADGSAPDGQSQYGERRNGTKMTESVSPDVQALLDTVMAQAEQIMAVGVVDPAVAAAATLNGHGGSAAAE